MIGVRTRKGLGDQLFGLAIVNQLRKNCPKKNVVALVRTIWPLHAYIASEAPFPVIDANTLVEFGKHNQLFKIQLEQRIPGGHILEGFYRNAARQVGAPIDDWPMAPAYFGPIPNVNREKIGLVYVEESRVDKPVVLYRHWRFGMRKLYGQLRERIGNIVEMSPWFSDSPRSLIEWVASCKLIVTPESGIYHLAAAIGIPCVVILGGKWTPSNVAYPGNYYITSNNCPDSPCRRWQINTMSCKEKIHKPPYEAPCIHSVNCNSVMDVVIRAINSI